jgi:hypothetical protein
MKTTVKVIPVAKNGFFGLKIKPEELETKLQVFVNEGWNIVGLVATDVTGQGGVSELCAVLTKSE